MRALWHISAFAMLRWTCGAGASTPTSNGLSQEWLLTQADGVVDSDGSATGLIVPRLFQQSTPFHILSISRNYGAHSSSRDTSECDGWSLTGNECATVLADFAPITGPDWHHFFDVFQCQIQGELSQDGHVFGFAINAGSWLSVACGDTGLLFGDMEKKYTELFVSPVWSEEED